jgi:uncharacterized lipoprotein YmbA
MRLAAFALGLTACALTSKSRPLEVEYFAPTAPIGEGTVRADASTEPEAPKVRLRRVFSGSHLRTRIAYRTSPVRLEFYEAKRWTEPPEEYARRALEQSLFERGLLVTGGAAPELEVEVIAFEEIQAPRHSGRVRLRYRLIDRREVVDERTIDVVRPAGATFDSLVLAIGAALDDASARLATDVNERLRARVATREAKRPRRADRER